MRDVAREREMLFDSIRGDEDRITKDHGICGSREIECMRGNEDKRSKDTRVVELYLMTRGKGGVMS